MSSLKAEHEARVDVLCARDLFQRAHQTVFLAPLGTLFLGWMALDMAGPLTVLAWMLLNSLPEAGNYWQTRRLLRNPGPDARVPFWHGVQVWLRFAQGLTWGSAAIFFHVEGPDAFELDMVVLVVLVAVSTSGVINMAPSFRTLRLFACGVLGVPAVFYLWLGDVQHVSIAVGLVILLLIEFKLGWDAWAQHRNGVRQLVMNQLMSERLAESMAEVRVANAALEQRNDELDRLNRELEHLATHDKLTGLYNRHFIVRQLEQLHQQQQRYGNPCSLILIDIDHFKRVNDSCGHAAGDAVLAAFARHVRPLLRQGDFPGRHGGEEFILVLPMTDLQAALQLAERVRGELAAIELPELPQDCRVTASFGVAQLAPGESLDDWLARADRALYRAKESGRNRVEAA
jgi:diguanylate cyclase (GGDEF)-like protein